MNGSTNVKSIMVFDSFLVCSIMSVHSPQSEKTNKENTKLSLFARS